MLDPKTIYNTWCSFLKGFNAPKNNVNFRHKGSLNKHGGRHGGRWLLCVFISRNIHCILIIGSHLKWPPSFCLSPQNNLFHNLDYLVWNHLTHYQQTWRSCLLLFMSESNPNVILLEELLIHRREIMPSLRLDTYYVQRRSSINRAHTLSKPDSTTTWWKTSFKAWESVRRQLLWSMLFITKIGGRWLV